MIRIDDTRALAVFIEANGLEAFVPKGSRDEYVCFELRDVNWRISVVSLYMIGKRYAVQMSRPTETWWREPQTTYSQTSLSDFFRDLVIQHHRGLLPDHAFLKITG
jgi:hypothetical protein